MTEINSVLAIGSVVGGMTMTARRWQSAIDGLARRVAHVRSDVLSPLRVNIVFHVPGDLVSPEFQGTRIARYSKKQALLLVQIALPVDLPEDADGYVHSAALEAIDAAETWARERATASTLEALRGILRDAEVESGGSRDRDKVPSG